MNQGNIVLVPFPFSDLSANKTRPALIVSNNNLKGNDFILCAITSKKSGLHEIALQNNDLDEGRLPLTSYIRLNKIVSLDKSIIRKTVAKLNKEKMEKVCSDLEKLIRAS